MPQSKIYEELAECVERSTCHQLINCKRFVAELLTLAKKEAEPKKLNRQRKIVCNILMDETLPNDTEGDIDKDGRRYKEIADLIVQSLNEAK